MRRATLVACATAAGAAHGADVDYPQRPIRLIMVEVNHFAEPGLLVEIQAIAAI